MSIYVYFSCDVRAAVFGWLSACIFVHILDTKSCTSTIYHSHTQILLFISSAPIYIFFLFSFNSFFFSLVQFCFVNVHYKWCPGCFTMAIHLICVIFVVTKSSSTEIVNLGSYEISNVQLARQFSCIVQSFWFRFGAEYRYDVAHRQSYAIILPECSFGSFNRTRLPYAHSCQPCLYAFVLWVLWLHVNQRNYTNDS